jgi:hypothetical protein
MEDSLELVINDQTEQVAEARRRCNDSDSDWDIARTVISPIALFGVIMIDDFLPSDSRRFLFFSGVRVITSSGLTKRCRQRRLRPQICRESFGLASIISPACLSFYR